MFQTGFLTGVFRCVIGSISPWRTVINHTFAVCSCLVVIVGWVYMQMHGVQWGCLISETLCFDCNWVSQLMKNQLLAMSRTKSNICLLWFHNRFQYCLKKKDPGSNDFSQWNPLCNSGWESHCSGFCTQTWFAALLSLFLFFLQGMTDCFWDILSKGKVSKEKQGQKELSWRVKGKVSFRYNDQGKRECV